MRHRFHAICPYFAMFPETFVQKNLIWSERGDLVMDPFCGRGTTVFESLLNGRRAIGCDTNAVAVCVSGAKVDPPDSDAALDRLQEIEEQPIDIDDPVQADPFYQTCFHPKTLREILHLRKHLNWKRRRADRFIAAVTLGALHGESHRSSRYLSNRMPRTISTKPEYSIRWWRNNGYVPQRRRTFEILRELIEFRFVSVPADRRGEIKQMDVRKSARAFGRHSGDVSLIITSPPYLDTTNFEEDQWLRLWFLGGNSRPQRSGGSDDRHRQAAKYWQFLREAWSGVAPLLREDAHIVVRIGGKKLDYDQIKTGLWNSLKLGLDRPLGLLDEITSEIVGGQRRTIYAGAEGTKREYDFHFRLG